MADFEDDRRFGGPQAAEADEESSDAKRKAEERERKKAEVRARLQQESSSGKKKKKGFLTPERKKKLRKLLMSKAAEDLKRQQLLKEQERQKILAQRTIPLPDVESMDDKGKLETIYNDLFSRLCQLEEEKYDINQQVLVKEVEINELTIAVNDLRGKFVKPTLKKVSKYDNKFKKMAESGKKEEKADFRTNLKTVKKDKDVFAQITAKKDKPEWSKKGGAADAKDAAPAKEEAPKEEPKEEAPAAEEEPPASEAEDASEAEASEAE